MTIINFDEIIGGDKIIKLQTMYFVYHIQQIV